MNTAIIATVAASGLILMLAIAILGAFAHRSEMRERRRDMLNQKTRP
jgi:hypothetical protein